MGGRVAEARKWSTPEGLEKAQRRVLAYLTAHGEATVFGREKGLSATDDYAAFRQMLTVTPYPRLRPWVMRMVEGEADVLWPGRCRRFAQSSGTSDGKSKFIPVSKEGLHDTHYAGGTDAVAWYLRNNPHSRLFDGKALILGGSHAPTPWGRPPWIP